MCQPAYSDTVSDRVLKIWVCAENTSVYIRAALGYQYCIQKAEKEKEKHSIFHIY